MYRQPRGTDTKARMEGLLTSKREYLGIIECSPYPRSRLGASDVPKQGKAESSGIESKLREVIRGQRSGWMVSASLVRRDNQSVGQGGLMGDGRACRRFEWLAGWLAGWVASCADKDVFVLVNEKTVAGGFVGGAEQRRESSSWSSSFGRGR